MAYPQNMENDFPVLWVWVARYLAFPLLFFGLNPGMVVAKTS